MQSSMKDRGQDLCLHHHSQQMHNSIKDRNQDLCLHHHSQEQMKTDPSDIEPMVLGGMNSDNFSNGHSDSYGSRDGSSSVSSEMSKKTLPPNGKKTKGRVKIKMEFIDNKLRRYTTFSKRKTGIMKKAYELSTLTGTQVMLLVASETGHVYTFATRKLQPMITSEAGKALIQTCLNSPDLPPGPGASLDQRMSATGFEETDLTYSVPDDCDKMPDSPENGGYASDMSPSPPSESILPHTLIPTSSSNSSQKNSSVVPTSTAMPSFTTILSAGTRDAKKTIPLSSSDSGTSSQNSISVVQSSSPNLSVMSGSVVLPQTILQTNNSGGLLYHTGQGLVYAAPANLSEGVVLNLGQENNNSQQQFITIPVSLSLSPAQQQQLVQGAQLANQSSSFNNAGNSHKEKRK